MRIAILIASMIVLLGCQKAPKAVTPAATYDAASVETRKIEVTVDASGVVEPESTVEVKSKASGEVLKVNGETGDIVEAGTLLVQIDKRTPSNNVSQSESALKAAAARRAIADTQLKRAEALYKSQTLTQADVEKAQLEFANADAQVVTSRVALENARITLEDTDVRAPITGTIIEKTVEPGIVITSPTQAVSGGTVLMKMADLNSVQVRTRVDETDIGKIRPGLPTKVTVTAYPNQPFEGEVLKVEPQAVVEQNVTMFPVLIKIPNRGGLLKPGMNADVKIQIANRDSVAAVPTAALRAEADVPVTAKMLGLDEAVLRKQIWPDGKSGAAAAGGKNVLSLNGREITLPPGVDGAKVQELMAKRRGGQQLTAEEQTLMRSVFQGAAGASGGGNAGNGGGQARSGGGGPPGGFPGGGFPGGFGVGGGPGAAPAKGAPKDSSYLFGGDYWVMVQKGAEAVPVAVKTGLTDLEFSEVVAGLAPGDRVLLMPSTSLYEQQERLQQFISQRFGGTPFSQGGGQPRIR
ncbi:MAG: efflux RND transporter periplasmic adaptor subunit [Gammaproteobacteria bacterium]